ncbi:MAG TPA: hypothetical protein PKE26_03650 [Kiritimatiellia bacterium]|nr:hypothetical protein [Kiritimatiellia bacterium]HMO98185.1 hypothetical protein [Kiritimatiellia bacterium]HMP97478.1 hypothetical protein [Kiritimatiellia bacterium]
MIFVNNPARAQAGFARLHLGDLVILSRDPTVGDVETINEIKVTETIKEAIMRESGMSGYGVFLLQSVVRVSCK